MSANELMLPAARTATAARPTMPRQPAATTMNELRLEDSKIVDSGE